MHIKLQDFKQGLYTCSHVQNSKQNEKIQNYVTEIQESFHHDQENWYISLIV